MLIERLEEIFDEEIVFTEMSVPVKKRKYSKFIKKLYSERETMIKLNALVSGNYGVYVFIDDIQDASQVRNYLLNKFKMRDSIFVFAETSTGGTYYDNERKEYIDFEKFYENIITFRQNHKIPECFKHKYKFETAEDYFANVYEPLENEEDEDDLYIRPLVTNSKLDDIDEILSNIEEEPETQGKYIYYSDGSMRVKKFVSRGILNGADCTFPCSDENPHKIYWSTVFLGWIGFHKFVHRKWGQGILYMLTCGLMGILPIFDLFSMLMGDYYYTDVDYDMGLDRKITKSSQRIYMRPLDKKWLCVIGIILALGITYVASNFIYQPVVNAFGDLLAMLTENLNAGDVENIVNGVPLN